MDAELAEDPTKTPPPEHPGAAAEGDEQTAATTTRGQRKKPKEARPQILVTPHVVEWVNSLIAQGVALPKDATAEERLTYRYMLNQRTKRLNKLQKSLRAEDLAEEDDEEDEGAQKRPAGKHRSRTRDMPPEALGATRKDLASDLNNQRTTDRKSTRLNSSHITRSRMPSSA